MNTHYLNFSNAQIILRLPSNAPFCESWLTLPGENVWPAWIRITLYVIVLLYLFMGIAVASDVFMFSIERITAKTRKMSVYDPELGHNVDVEVFVWNETVANLTLMAFGSSAPEILLAAIEAVKSLKDPPENAPDSLGLFTILGSAAFNLFAIAGICVISIPSPAVKRIEKFGVFLFTSICSLFAYAWMLLATVYISPQVIELWEAIVTFSFFPLMVVFAYAQDNGWWVNKRQQAKSDVACSSERENSYQMKVSTEDNGEPGDHERDREPIPEIDAENVTEDKTRRSIGQISNRRNTIRQSPFRRFMFRQMAMNRLSRLNQYVRRVSTDCGYLGSTVHNFGRAFFPTSAYKIVLGTPEISIPVHLQRHPTVDDCIPECIEREDEVVEHGSRQNEANGTTAALENDPNRKECDNADNQIATSPKLSRPSGRRLSKLPADSRFETLANGTFIVGYEIRPGLAKPGIHYDNISGGVLCFTGEETEQMITIQLNEDRQVQSIAEPIDFHVVLIGNPNADLCHLNLEGTDSSKQWVALPGTPSVLRVQLLSPNALDYFEMQASHFYVDQATNTISITVVRQGTCHATSRVHLVTRDGTAKQMTGNNEFGEYESINEILHFESGEMSKSVTIEIKPSKQCRKYFIAELVESEHDGHLGNHREAICYLHSMEYTETVEDIAAGDIGWAQQFRMAVTLIPNVNEDGMQIPLTNMDYALHGITFFWKLICAFLPPRKYLGAYPTFLASLAFIGLLTALVEEFSNLLGCVAGIKTVVTGISLVALGTSLPDAFASRTAARFDDSADNSIGNITGSNSVNVFLGLGLPWLISAVYAHMKGTQHCVATAGVFEGTILFLSSAILVLSILILRRKCYHGELGGPNLSKWICGLCIMTIWFVYVTVLTLKAYNIIRWEPSIPKSTCPINI